MPQRSIVLGCRSTYENHQKVSCLGILRYWVNRRPALHLIRPYQAAALRVTEKAYGLWQTLTCSRSRRGRRSGSSRARRPAPQSPHQRRRQPRIARPAKALRSVGKLFHQASARHGTPLHWLVEHGSLPGEGQSEASASPTGLVHFWPLCWSVQWHGSEVMSLQPPPGWMARCTLLVRTILLSFGIGGRARPRWVSCRIMHVRRSPTARSWRPSARFWKRRRNP